MEYESEHIDRHDSRKRQSKLLDIHDMSVSYRGSMVQMDTSLSNASCNAVTDVSLSVRAGDILGIVGESGAGKSTLLHALIRLLPQSADITGNALFEGHDLLSLNEAELDRVRGDRIAMIFQNPGRMFDPSMRIGAQVTEVVCMHRGCTKREGKKVSIDLLKRMGFA
jgi:ABC-type glutathione transport system ATPase component